MGADDTEPKIMPGIKMGNPNKAKTAMQDKTKEGNIKLPPERDPSGNADMAVQAGAKHRRDRPKRFGPDTELWGEGQQPVSHPPMWN